MDLSLVSKHNHVGKKKEKSGTQLQPYLPQVKQVKPHRAEGLLIHKDVHNTNILICLGSHKHTNEKLIE